MSYTTKEYYQAKSDQELYKIFSGATGSTYNEKIWAQKVLEERGFDFSQIKKIKDSWEEKEFKSYIQSKRMLVDYILDHPSGYTISLIFLTAIGLFLIIVLLDSIKSANKENIFLFSLVLSFYVLVFIANIAFRKSRLRAIKRDKELYNKYIQKKKKT